ncbi:MAG TPA: hypothetical protein VGR21_13845 [Cryptosporangiaceae bacterium]|nr:hypothetical protein [Cryptosporangiaceae bacterium]
MRTNSDLYLALRALGQSNAGRRRPLEEYLRAFWWLGYERCDTELFHADDLVALAEGALSAEAPPPDRAWAQEDLGDEVPDGFAGWSRILRAQICDLGELAKSGGRSRPLVGVTAPRAAGRRPTGASWVNLDVPSYLEGGAQGAFGGWRPEFDDAEVDVDPPAPVPLWPLGWHDLTVFAVCGQSYE